MKRSFREVFARSIILIIGLTIAHFGVTLFVLSNLGTDPFNVLVRGLFVTLKELTGLSFLTHGRVHIASCLLIIAVLIFVDRSYIKIGTVLCMIFGGPIIDIFTVVLAPVFEMFYNLPFRFIALLLGCIILAYGMTIVIKSDAGTGPNDLVAIVISDKSKKKFSIIRIAVDLLFVIIGYFLGGVVGIGTVICAFCIGPVAGFFLPVNEKLVNSILNKLNKQEKTQS